MICYARGGENKNMKLILHGQIPALKNSKKVTKTGHIYTEKRVKDWMEAAASELKEQWHQPQIEKLDNLTVCIYNGDKRKHDLSNQLDTILDVLKLIVVKDDNQFCIPEVQLHYAGVDSDPRAEIWVDFES